MASPDLVPVPYKNGSFCRIKEGKLIVIVKNEGDANAANEKTQTRVEWGLGGVYDKFVMETVKETDTKNLAPGAEAPPLEFECPKQCFAPDCEFYITVDIENKSGEDEQHRYNNTKKGVCYERDKPFLPDLVPVQYEDSKTYYERNGNKLKVKIKNMGSAIAEPSKTEVKFQDGTKKNKKCARDGTW